MTEQEMKARTRNFSLAVIQMVDELGRDRVSDHLGRQLLRCATSVGANYRSACRAKSVADMIAKLAIVEEEADEVPFWTDLLVASERIPSERIAAIDKEANEILAIIVASIKTLRARGNIREELAPYDSPSQAATLNGARNPKSKIQNPK